LDSISSFRLAIRSAVVVLQPVTLQVEMPVESKPKQPTSEFNHAVQYVAKIKVCNSRISSPHQCRSQNRFKDQPEIYSEFLDILHDYQVAPQTRTSPKPEPTLSGEPHHWGSVLSRAAPLRQFVPARAIQSFAKYCRRRPPEHTDLLYEFKYFLPDNGSAKFYALWLTDCCLAVDAGAASSAPALSAIGKAKSAKQKKREPAPVRSHAAAATPLHRHPRLTACPRKPLLTGWLID
jgi:histone deacetylase complex regulatory component SIN3